MVISKHFAGFQIYIVGRRIEKILIKSKLLYTEWLGIFYLTDNPGTRVLRRSTDNHTHIFSRVFMGIENLFRNWIHWQTEFFLIFNRREQIVAPDTAIVGTLVAQNAPHFSFDSAVAVLLNPHEAVVARENQVFGKLITDFLPHNKPTAVYVFIVGNIHIQTNRKVCYVA